MTTDGEYVLATGETAVPRLVLLDKIFGPSTNMLLSQAGLRPGLRVVEMGCGAGFTTCSLARAVGPTGRVSAVDISGDQLAIARSNACRARLDNIDFIEAGATTTALPDDAADLVYCRLLFSHIRQVGDAIAEFRRLLKVGGVLACEELIVQRAYSIPEIPAYSRVGQLAAELSAKTGMQYSIGDQLPQLVRSAGLEVQCTRTVQPAYFSGEEKRWWEYSFREVSPMLIKTGLLDSAEVESLLAALQAAALDDSVLLAQPAMAQVLARRATI